MRSTSIDLEFKRFHRRHRHLRGVYLIHGWRSEPHSKAHSRIFAIMSWLVASTRLDTGPRLMARPGRDPQSCIWLRLPEERLLEKSEEFIAHIGAAWPEYQPVVMSHPFEWTWTNQRHCAAGLQKHA